MRKFHSKNFVTSSSSASNKKVALLLAGCGARDGSEITEATALMIALTQAGFQLDFYAPERLQMHVVDHMTGMVIANEQRNMQTEAARIARGRVLPLKDANIKEYFGVVLPGGYGSVKNLCNYATAGKDATLMHDVKQFLLPFLEARKPLGALCIAPVILALAARELGWQGASLTLGDGSAKDAIAALEFWGARHVSCAVDEAVVDENSLFVSAPAYMHENARSCDIFSSAQALVGGLLTLTN